MLESTHLVIRWATLDVTLLDFVDQKLDFDDKIIRNPENQ